LKIEEEPRRSETDRKGEHKGGEGVDPFTKRELRAWRGKVSSRVKGGTGRTRRKKGLPPGGVILRDPGPEP